jgi:hypothetical protein
MGLEEGLRSGNGVRGKRGMKCGDYRVIRLNVCKGVV